MARSRPVLLTAALSAAAVLGYLTYRARRRRRRAGRGEDRRRRGAAGRRDAARFSLANLAGEQQSIQSWPGKPLLINFWATWCGAVPARDSDARRSCRRRGPTCKSSASRSTSRIS